VPNLLHDAQQTRDGQLVVRTRNSLPKTLEKVQYMRKWPKSDPSCSDGLESGHLLFCPRISFKGLGSILGPGDLWPLVPTIVTGGGPRQQQSRYPKTRHAKCVRDFWAEKTLCYEAFCQNSYSFSPCLENLQGSKPT